MRLTRQRAFLLLGLILIPVLSCVHYKEKPLEPATRAQNLASRSLVDTGLERFVKSNAAETPRAWPPRQWGLSSLTLAALYFHPDLDVARANWAAARARDSTSGIRRAPSASLEPGYNLDTSTPSPWILSSFLSWSIESGSKRSARRGRERYRAEAARHQVAAVAWAVRSRVRQSMVALYSARQVSELLQQEQDLLDENVRRTEQRHDAGLASGFERTQASVAEQRSRLALHDAKALAALAKIQLTQAIGVAPDALDKVSLSFTELSTAPTELAPSEARATALMNRADLLSALASYAASEANLQLEIARQYPDFKFGLGYVFDQGDSIWSLPMSISLPLFNRNQRAIAEANAARETSAAKFTSLQFQVLHAVAQAQAGYEAAQRKSLEAGAIVSDSESLVQHAEAMLASGQISSADIVARRLEASAAYLARSTADAELLRALGVLEDALQSPLGLASSTWQISQRSHDTSDDGPSRGN